MRQILGFSIVTFLLVAASLAIWQLRFIEVPGGIPDLKLGDPLVGWVAKPHNQFEVTTSPEGPILRLARENPSEKMPSIHAWFSPKPNVSAIHIRCETRWKNVTAGTLGYTIARIVSMMRDKDGKVMHPPDFGITWGTGDKDWHRSEAVLSVTPDMADLGLEISMLGDHGMMEVKNLEVTAVRNRSWVPAATGAVLVGWITLCALLLQKIGKTVSLWRILTASVAIVIAGWIFVFPQPKGMAHPVIGNFIVEKQPSEKIIQPPAPAPAPATNATPAIAAPPQPQPAEVHASTPPVVKRAPEPEIAPVALEKPHVEEKPVHRPSNRFYKFLRATDKVLPVAHLGLFTAITLGILIITGDGRQWPLPLALAILSELVPELVDHLGGWDDWTDVLQNIAGVALAVFLWNRLRLLRRNCGSSIA